MIRFKALINFKSKEFAGTQYVAGMNYTLREGNKKLALMASRWEKAKLFKVNEDLEFFGVIFVAGSTSYHIDDDFGDVVKSWSDSGKVEYIEGALISFDVAEESGTLGAL